MHWNEDIERFLEKMSGSSTLISIIEIQELWSGYGSIIRVTFENPSLSYIVKVITQQSAIAHPRGWNTSFSHQRKVKSYEVESTWYNTYNNHLPENIKTPKFVTEKVFEHYKVIVLEDLDSIGYTDRFSILNENGIMLCVDWIAAFHKHFMLKECNSLWEEGSYWHLDTRPDEYERMEEGYLKDNAMRLDQKLKNCKFPTLIHGDAKVANFCFDGLYRVAAVDFQYIGKGSGTKDLIYLMSSCLNANNCFELEQRIIKRYIEAFEDLGLNGFSYAQFKNEFLELYPYAWADFARFLEGWSPGHYKMNSYVEHQIDKIIN